MGSHEDFWYPCRLHKIQVLGNFNQQAFMHNDVFRLCSPTCQAHHSLTRLPGLHQWSDSIYFARKFKSWNIRR